MAKRRWPEPEDPLARYQEWADNRYSPGHWLGANVPPDTRGLWSTRDRRWLGLLYTAAGIIGFVMAVTMAQDVTSFLIAAGMLLTVLVPGILMLLGPDSKEPRRRRRGKTARLVFFLALTGASTEATSAQPATSRAYVSKPTDFAVVCTLFNSARKRAPEEPITYDAHFIIGARIEHTKFGTSPWADGTAINFAIHSPTLLFRGRAFSGHRFLLVFSRFSPTTDSDKVWYAPETRYILRDIERMDALPDRGPAPATRQTPHSNGASAPTRQSNPPPAVWELGLWGVGF